MIVIQTIAAGFAPALPAEFAAADKVSAAIGSIRTIRQSVAVIVNPIMTRFRCPRMHGRIQVIAVHAGQGRARRGIADRAIKTITVLVPVAGISLTILVQVSLIRVGNIGAIVKIIRDYVLVRIHKDWVDLDLQCFGAQRQGSGKTKRQKNPHADNHNFAFILPSPFA
jgi:hypothetical protein